MGPWKRLGPAVRGGPLPVVGVTVSVLGHAALVGALVLFAGLWHASPSKVYVVNLVAGIAGARPGPLETPTLPPLPRTPPRVPQEAEEPPKLPSLPALTRPATPLPPPSALPRLEERKPPLPPKPAESSRPRPSPGAEARAAARPPEPATAPAGVSAEVSDFPFAWYLRQVLAKVEREWAKRPPIPDPPQRPVIFVEILRDGSITPPRLQRSSGNAFYDQAAVRAITEASPFPQLPQEWNRPTLRIQFGFELGSSRG